MMFNLRLDTGKLSNLLINIYTSKLQSVTEIAQLKPQEGEGEPTMASEHHQQVFWDICFHRHRAFKVVYEMIMR